MMMFCSAGFTYGKQFHWVTLQDRLLWWQVAPSHEGLELGIGDSILMKVCAPPSDKAAFPTMVHTENIKSVYPLCPTRNCCLG